ncbi:MAG: hypothetical protein WDO69_28470 [Pseudomonadota bacterium]
MSTRVLASRPLLWLCLLPLAALQCTLDERPLNHSDSAVDAPTWAGAAGAESESLAGEGGSSDGFAGRLGGAGMVGDAAGAATSFGGKPPVDAGGNGAIINGGAAGASGAVSDAAGGAAGSDTPFAGPCGDIDHDAVDDCEETLLLDSRFDADLTHWVAGPNLVQAWDPRDARSLTSSGSIFVTNQVPIAAVDAWVMAGTEQCVSVTERVEYELAARVMIPNGQGLGEAGLNLYVFAGDGCSGVFLGGLTPGLTAKRGGWVVVDGQVEMPLAARSMVVRLVTSKPFTQATLSAFFDDVLVRAWH